MQEANALELPGAPAQLTYNEASEHSMPPLPSMPPPDDHKISSSMRAYLEDFGTNLQHSQLHDLSEQLELHLDSIRTMLQDHHSHLVETMHPSTPRKKSLKPLEARKTLKTKAEKEKVDEMSNVVPSADSQHTMVQPDKAEIEKAEGRFSSRDSSKSAGKKKGLRFSEGVSSSPFQFFFGRSRSSGAEPDMPASEQPSSSADQLTERKNWAGPMIRRSATQAQKDSDESSKPTVVATITRQLSTHIGAQMDYVKKFTEFAAQDKVRLGFVNRQCFSTFSGAAIVANMIYIALQSDALVRGSYGEKGVFNSLNWVWGDLVFCIVFSTEVALRGYSLGTFAYLFGKDYKWNRFDLLVVICSIVDFFAENFSNAPGIGLRVLRSLRLFRLIRLLKTAGNVPLVRHLKIMIHSLYGCMSSFLPAVVLLLFVMYMFGIAILQGVTNYFEENSSDSAVAVSLIEHFGSFPVILLTLLSAVSAGEDWMNYATPLGETGLVYQLTFMLYICLVMFGVLNILTGIFVNVAFSSCTMSRDIVTEAAVREKHYLIANIVEAFMEADEDNSGTLSFDEFQQYMLDENVRAYFTSLDIDVACAERIFTLLDDSDDGHVDLIEFVQGCLAHRGHARAIDTYFLERRSQEGIEATELVQEVLLNKMERIEKLLIGKDAGLRLSAGLPATSKHLQVAKTTESLHLSKTSASLEVHSQSSCFADDLHPALA